VLGITPEGETLVRYARRILHLNDEAYAAIVQPEISGTVHLGVPADFLERDLPALLDAFSHRHSLVHLEIRSDLSRRLQDATDRGLLDVAFIKQDPTRRTGQPVLREPLYWAVGGRMEVAGVTDDGVLPLVLFLDGCIYRQLALEALEKAGLPWRIAFETPSHSALRAAVVSGLGVSALPRALIDGPLRALDAAAGLPALVDSEIAVVFAPGKRHPASGRLATFITEGLRRGGPPDERDLAASAEVAQ
jgi:DNA-binding transcriptional LysR family regulator